MRTVFLIIALDCSIRNIFDYNTNCITYRNVWSLEPKYLYQQINKKELSFIERLSMCWDGFQGYNLHVGNVQMHSRNSFWAPMTFPALLMAVDAVTNKTEECSYQVYSLVRQAKPYPLVINVMGEKCRLRCQREGQLLLLPFLLIFAEETEPQRISK